MTWQNRYLWWLGFFMAFSGGSIRMFNFSSSGENSSQDLEKIWNFISSNLDWIIPSVVFLFLLFIFLMILGTIARAGVIRAVEKIEKKENFGFKDAMREGKKYFWKLFFLGAILLIVLSLILAVMAMPIVLLFVAHSYIIGGILTFIAILIFIPLATIFAFIKIYGQLYIVLGKISLKASIENAYRLFLKNILKSLIMALIFIPLSILMSFAVLFLALIIVIIFGIPGILLFLALKTTGIIIAASLAILVFIFIVLVLSSFFQSFSQIVWVLLFKEIASPKAEEVLKEITEEELLAQKNPEPCGTISTSEIE